MIELNFDSKEMPEVFGITNKRMAELFGIIESVSERVLKNHKDYVDEIADCPIHGGNASGLSKTKILKSMLESVDAENEKLLFIYALDRVGQMISRKLGTVRFISNLEKIFGL